MAGDIEPKEAERAKPARAFESVLPTEIWALVMDEFLYKPADFSADLQPTDLGGTRADMEEEREAFKSSFYLVCKEIYVIAYRRLSRYITLTSQADIDSLHVAFKRGPCVSSDNVGSWARRLDLRIEGAYLPSTVSRLVERMPNIRVLVISNKTSGGDTAVRFRPDAIVDAVRRHCTRMRRIQFESWGEEPTVRMLKEVLLSLQDLQTVHFDCAYWPAQGDDDNDDPIEQTHNSLRTLSIGSVCRRHWSADGLDRAGAFLRACTPNHVLPKLTTLHLQQGIPSMAMFLEEYGPQLQELGYGTGENTFAEGHDWEEPDDWHPHVITYTPNLRSLVLFTTEWPMHAPVGALLPHATIQAISIVYLRPEHVSGGGRGAILLALQLINGTRLPRLDRVTVFTTLGTAPIEAVDGWFGTVRDVERKGIEVKVVPLPNT